jgi:mediator of RNA polymerase II transcription subunit 22
MVRAGESLMKLVSDLKQYLILNDFPSVNEAISQNSNMFKEMQVRTTQIPITKNKYNTKSDP